MDNLKLERNSNSRRDNEFYTIQFGIVIYRQCLSAILLKLNLVGIIYFHLLINHTFGFAPCVLQKKWICGKDEKSRRKTGVLLCLELN
jgi:hypothetical protein